MDTLISLVPATAKFGTGISRDPGRRTGLPSGSSAEVNLGGDEKGLAFYLSLDLFVCCLTLVLRAAAGGGDGDGDNEDEDDLR